MYNKIVHKDKEIYIEKEESTHPKMMGGEIMHFFPLPKFSKGAPVKFYIHKDDYFGKGEGRTSSHRPSAHFPAASSCLLCCLML